MDFSPKLRDKIQNGKPGFEAIKIVHFSPPYQMLDVSFFHCSALHVCV